MKEYHMQGKWQRIYEAEKWILTEKDPQKAISAASSAFALLDSVDDTEGVDDDIIMVV